MVVIQLYMFSVRVYTSALLILMRYCIDLFLFTLCNVYVEGFARIAAESDRNHPPIHWVLPPGLTAKTLSGVFTLDWISRFVL
jgi:hypothetical protein